MTIEENELKEWKTMASKYGFQFESYEENGDTIQRFTPVTESSRKAFEIVIPSDMIQGQAHRLDVLAFFRARTESEVLRTMENAA